MADELRALGQWAAMREGVIERVPPELRPVVLASAALFVCETYIVEGKIDRLASCDVSREVDRFASGVDWSTDRQERAPAVGRSLARSMQLALDAKPGEGADKVASTPRAVAALAGAFDAACYAVDRTKELGCPATLDVPAGDAERVVKPLSVARGVLEAALERDSNRLIASVGRGLDLIATLQSDEATSRERRRALRLLSGLAQYAETFAGTGDKDGAKHEQRTKVLESLTADMTDRSGREGDWIVSLGGSLAAAGGWRVHAPGGQGGGLFSGPLSLSLGGAVQRVPESDYPGPHFELGVIDLAQYLSFRRDIPDGGGETKAIVVSKPKLSDALVPSVKVGLQWGREVPLYVAGFAQYAPFYEYETSAGVDRHGSFIFGVAAGAYVPLLDAN